MVFKHMQGWWLNHLPGEPVPVLNNPFCKEVFPNVQPKLTLVQLEAIFPCPVTCHQWEETILQFQPKCTPILVYDSSALHFYMFLCYCLAKAVGCLFSCIFIPIVVAHRERLWTWNDLMWNITSRWRALSHNVFWSFPLFWNPMILLYFEMQVFLAHLLNTSFPVIKQLFVSSIVVWGIYPTSYRSWLKEVVCNPSHIRQVFPCFFFHMW